MRACGSYKWIPHIDLQPAVPIRSNYHHASFHDDRVSDPLRYDDVAKSLSTLSLGADESLSKPSPHGSWSVLAVLEHFHLSVAPRKVLCEPTPPLCVNMEVASKPKVDISVKLNKVSFASLDVTSPFGSASNTDASEAELNALELVTNKEFSPSESTAAASSDPGGKDSDLYSFLYDANDTDTDDDIFPPTTIHLDSVTQCIPVPSTGTLSISPSPNIQGTAANKLGKENSELYAPKVHVPCRNLWELM